MEESVYKTKVDFKYFSELNSSDLKEFVTEHKNFSLQQIKEILYILQIREKYKIENSPLLIEIISHFGLVRSGELHSSQGEINSYTIVDLMSSKKELLFKSPQKIANLKMLHAGDLISKGGKSLFISTILIISVLILNIIFSALIYSNPENYTQNNLGSVMILSGITFLVSIFLQLKGFSSLHNAGEIFKTPE